MNGKISLTENVKISFNCDDSDDIVVFRYEENDPSGAWTCVCLIAQWLEQHGISYRIVTFNKYLAKMKVIEPEARLLIKLTFKEVYYTLLTDNDLGNPFI